MSEAQPVAEPFVALEQQRHAVLQGTWIFLATELLLFSGGLIGYLVYRLQYGTAFANGSPHLDLKLATINTAILLTSSLTMALADRAAEIGRRRAAAQLLGITSVLGIVFLSIKGVEYAKEYHEGLIPFLNSPFALQGEAPEQIKLFFNLYFVMTGLHALHLAVGVALATVLAVRIKRGEPDAAMVSQVNVGALYWHFVDVVWVFLFPMFYLVR